MARLVEQRDTEAIVKARGATITHRPKRGVLGQFCALLFGLFTLLGAPVEGAVILSDAAPRVDVWRSLTLLQDRERALTIESALSARERFRPPETAHGTLGVREGAVWLRLPFRRGDSQDAHWVFEINYPPMQWIDVWLFRNGTQVGAWRMGSLRPFGERPLLARGHAVPLELTPDGAYELIVRAESDGALVMPVTLSRLSQFQATEAREQMLQGLLNGIGVTLLIYSLISWLLLRESQYLAYVVLVAGSLGFSLLQLGVGTQYLWTDRLWWQQHLAGITSLTATLGAFLFFWLVLVKPPPPRWFVHVMRTGAIVSALLLVVYCLDVFDNRTLTAIIAVMGLLPASLALPVAIGRAWRGDAIGIALVVGWLVHTTGTFVITGVIRGTIDVNFWTLHAYQFGATFDLLVFIYILGFRTREERQLADRAQLERGIMQSLAFTDPLTGLANRRGLAEAAERVLPSARRTSRSAFYLIDLDGFKPINDRYGHDAGDELLRGVADRLRSAVRAGDIVARTGGGEFVVLAPGLATAEDAAALGDKLLATVSQPFDLAVGSVQVGMTVGYALAPDDGQALQALGLVADRAMYDGKQAGKGCVVRGRTLEPVAFSVPSAGDATA